MYLWISLVQDWYCDRYCWTLDFDSSRIGLDLDSRSQECKKAKKGQASLDAHHYAFTAHLFFMLWCMSQATHTWLPATKKNLAVVYVVQRHDASMQTLLFIDAARAAGTGLDQTKVTTQWKVLLWLFVGCLAGCSTSQQHARVSQGQICSGKCVHAATLR